MSLWLWLLVALVVDLTAVVSAWLVIRRSPSSDAEAWASLLIALLIWPVTAWMLLRSRNVGKNKDG